MTPDARAIIREFLDNEDKAVSFLQSAISPEPFERKTFKLNDFVEEIFEGHESFKARLEEWEEFNNEQVNEFKEFYLKSEEQNHSAYIVFEFKHLKLTYA